MESSSSRENKTGPRVNLKVVGALLLLVLAVLILSSKTIYSANLPEVYAVRPENGRLNKLEMGTGTASMAEVERVYAAVGGVCGEVLAKAGDRVEAGQVLCRMEYDSEGAERRLREIAASRAKLEIDEQNILLRLERIERSMSEAGY
jgi:multidrug efflux pump subunit AcrA (membrane-fusion protein)